jgi:hypothetical protein
LFLEYVAYQEQHVGKFTIDTLLYEEILGDGCSKMPDSMQQQGEELFTSLVCCILG